MWPWLLFIQGIDIDEFVGHLFDAFPKHDLFAFKADTSENSRIKSFGFSQKNGITAITFL